MNEQKRFTLDDLFLPAVTGGAVPDYVREAFHAPDMLSAQEIGQRDMAAEAMGTTYGEADAGWDDVATEMKIRRAETVPNAEKWVADSAENAAFLDADGEALMAVYDDLIAKGLIREDDIDSDTIEEIAQAGPTAFDDTFERGRLSSERMAVGLAYRDGRMTAEKARAEIARIDKRLALLAKRRGDPLGFYSFVEQGYRMLSQDLPLAAQRAAEGALYGASAAALAGSVVPGIGNVAGAGVGAVAGLGAGAARGMFESSQTMEEANFLADMLTQKDDAGQYLDEGYIREAAALYGTGSALVEFGGDLASLAAAKFISPAVKTVMANLGVRSPAIFAKDAIKTAVRHQKAWPVIRRFLLGLGAGALAEGTEEAVQEGISAQVEASMKNWLADAGVNYYREEQDGIFAGDTWRQMVNAGWEGAKVGAWFVLLPGVAQLAVDSVRVSRAREFAQAVKDVTDTIAATQTKELSPARMETFLQAQGLNQTVYLPADALWQMQLGGADIAQPLGWEESTLEEAAALGHDIAVPFARLEARLDPAVMKQVADIMKEGPDTPSFIEAEDPNLFLSDDIEAIDAAAQEWEFEQNLLDFELERLRADLTAAVRSVPNLLKDIAGSADTETSVGTYVDSLVRLVEKAAQRLRVYGDDVDSIISKLNIQGLVRDMQGVARTPEEIEQMVAEAAQAQADAPFWDNVWGRLDAGSLLQDFPEARKELARLHGRGLFARRGEGVAVDELADMLKNAGWLPEDADSSTLVEMLKEKKSPKRGRGQSWAADFLRQVDTTPRASMELVRRKYEGKETWMKAPNGKPTNLTEQQWLQVRTPEFKAWFGDWENDPENASKVVDENGEPKVVWHGTRDAGFHVFDTDGYGKTADTGAWFAGTKQTASTYSGTRDEMVVLEEDGEQFIDSGAYNYPVFLNIRNPYVYPVGGRNWDNVGGVSIYDTEADEYIYNYPDGRIFDFPYEDAAWDYVENELEDPDHERYEVQWSDETTDSVTREVRAGWMGDEYDGVIFEDVQDSGGHGDSWPDTDYIVFAPEQVKSATHNVGTFSTREQSILYQSYPELDDQRRAAVDAYLDALDDGAEVRARLEKHRGTPWEKQTIESILIRIAMEDIFAGRPMSVESKLGAPSVRKFTDMITKLGAEGAWLYLRKNSIIGHASKAVNAINSSYVNCSCSDNCAKYCYATSGNYAFPVSAVKSELVSWAVETDPIRAADMAAVEYKATIEFDAGKALRLFDKGDMSPQWIPFIKRLNENGIRVQAFSKRPELLRQLDFDKNVLMLSIDRSNLDMAAQNPDLPIAFVYEGTDDLPFLEANRERFEKNGGVILPVIQGKKLLDESDLKALPRWSRAFQCPVDNGIKEVQGRDNPTGWNCTKCDKNGGLGCFYGRTLMAYKKKEKGDGVSVEAGKRDEAVQRIEADVRRALEGLSADERRRFLDQLVGVVHQIKRDGYGESEGRDPSAAGSVDGRESGGAFVEDTLFQMPVQEFSTNGKNFKEWFRNSKAIGENGEPLILYHGSNAQIGDDFAFDYGFIGAHGSAEGYGFYLTTDESTASGYAGKSGSVARLYLSIQQPMPLDQKRFSKVKLRAILKRLVELEVEQYPDDITDYRDSFLSNYTDTYSKPFSTVLDEVANTIYESSANALDMISELANASGNKENAVLAVRDVTGFDGVVANGYGNRGEAGGTIYVAWFPEQIKSVDNHGAFSSEDSRIFYQQPEQAQTQATASITPTESGDYAIQLFQGANLSTLAHEIAHAVHLEMERLDLEGKATPALKRDLAVLQNWTAAMDDDATLKAEYNRYQKSIYGVEFEELDTMGKLAVRQRAKREMVARGFEQYLREGVSPSAGMEGVFRRFKKWMMRVYRRATMLNVELTDEVREVFAHLVASDEEIAAAAAKNSVHSESAGVLDALGVQGADRLELEGMIADAKDKAADALRRSRARYRRDHVQEWRDAVEQELDADPVYRARKALRRTPIDLDSVVETYGQDLADRLRVSLPASIKRGGENPELFAFDYGFGNAGEMINAILNRPGTQERRKELLAQKREEADARYAAEDFLFEQEEIAQQQDKIGEIVYRLELEGRTQGGKPVAAQGRERWKAAREQIKTIAEQYLDGKKAGEAVRPDIYRTAAARLVREERDAILAKDWGTALQANYKARLNLEIARQAAQRRDMVEKLTGRARRFLDSTSPDKSARFAVFALSQNIRLFEPTRRMVQNAADKGMEDIHDFLEEMRDAGYYTVDAEIPDDLFTTAPGAWRGMAWEELRPYIEAMTVIMHMEQASRKANSEAAKAAWRFEMDTIAANIYAENRHAEPGPFAKKKAIIEKLKEFHASHLKADTICRLLDGDKDFGLAWSAIILPINRATVDRDRRLRKAQEDVQKLFSVYSAREWVDIRSARIFVQALNSSVTKEQILAMALNCGNASNMQRLMDGLGLSEAQIQAVINELDEKDVVFVQAVWDYLETFRKESFDLEESITGVRPQAIEAQPLQTRFGELRGGYYPVVYDREQSSKPIDTESIGTLTGSMMPAVDHGSLKQRTATGLGTALQLDLEAIPRHVERTVHMLAFRKPIQKVARVLNDKKVNSAIESTAGVAQARALKSWLHYVAGERPGRNGWSRALGMLRKNASLYTMGMKLTTMLAQTTGLLAAVAEIGPRWVMAGIVKTYAGRNPFMVYRETIALSSVMENRIRSVDRDLYELSTGLMAKGVGNKYLDPLVRFKAWQERNAYLPMGFIQMALCDLPTWQGAYAKAIHEGFDGEKAVQYADGVVERTQVGGADKDLAGVQRGEELGKIMTQFYSYFSALYQLYARRITMAKRRGSTADMGRLATLFLLTGVLEPILSAVVTRNTPDEGEDDEDWLAWGAQKVFFNPFNMVIGVRDISAAVESMLEGYSGRARVGSLLNDVIDTGVRFTRQLEKGMDMDAHKVFDSGWKLAGLLTGQVNAQELLLIDALWDWLDGTNPDFELADLVRRKK